MESLHRQLPHYRHRFPAEIIMPYEYHVFSLSLRDVELLLAERVASSRSMPEQCGVRHRR